MTPAARNRAQLVALLALLAALLVALYSTYRGLPPLEVVQPAGLSYAAAVALAAGTGPLHLGLVVLSTVRYIGITLAAVLLVAWSGGRALLHLAGVA